MARRRRYREPPDLEPATEPDAKIRTMTEVADRDIEEARENVRSGRDRAARGRSGD